MIEGIDPARGATYHIPGTGPSHDPNRGHLWVVLTDTCQNGLNLLVPIATQRAKPDRTCLLGLGDHPFITHPSYVLYQMLKLWAAESVKTQCLKKIIRFEGQLDGRVFARISMGVTESRHSTPKMRTYYAEQAIQQRGATQPGPTSLAAD